ncbi:TMEM14 family protein [Candidatus Protochlamydia amoebophila]|uniref:Uncharacterized protein n=2 Tax=Candidatus Protochlamydia amoebophila TaxID=362787 RepID=Q6MCJ5_PARUW|nr:TMEM14 family protein [Candidatus Protochlamydia amoebophila]KIC72016.1 hypothetical protein DB44_CS00180 [Candidatus Protochlamydia amoebophila]CAF23704.1 unnamed protein product [Candidatus Protochlamydia amoebophila UWE25]
MQGLPKVIWIYAIIVLIGGIVGHAVANSLASLIASSITAAILLGCGYLVHKGQSWGYYGTLLIAGLLLAFFGYRFSLSYKFMPAGLMLVLTTALLAYLLTNLKAFCCRENSL